MSGQEIKIAVAGAGIGGLAAAAMLADLGHQVTLFDQFDTPRPVGSGLVIQPVGQNVLDIVGAGEAARAWGNPISRMLGHECENGRRVLDVTYTGENTGEKGLAIHRAALFQALFDAVCARPITLVTGHCVTGKRSDRAGHRLTFANGDVSAPFDLIIDGLGAKSPLSPIAPRALPYGAIWGSVDWPQTALPSDQLSQTYRKANRMIGALPIGCLPDDPTPKAAVFWSLPATSYDAWRAQGLQSWKDEATSLWPEFAPFLDQISDPDQMTMARYNHGTLKRPYSDGVIHIGDAAHQASPQLGQGANMALLDAYGVARALQLHPLDEAPRAYMLARRWHVRIYQTLSAAFTPQYQSTSRWLPVFRDRILFPASMIPPIPRFLTSLVCGTMLPPLGSLTPRIDASVPRGSHGDASAQI